MKKIPTLFVRHESNHSLVVPLVTPGCEWVTLGEGIATVKWDGTACLAEGGDLFRRYDAKHGRPAPPDFRPAQDPDPITGHWPGWIPVLVGRPADKWHIQALGNHPEEPIADGTYELCGPKVNGNPHNLPRHQLLRHGGEDWFVGIGYPRTFEGMRELVNSLPFEGVVWYHPDGRRAKVKRRDFGLPWPGPVVL